MKIKYIASNGALRSITHFSFEQSRNFNSFTSEFMAIVYTRPTVWQFRK